MKLQTTCGDIDIDDARLEGPAHGELVQLPGGQGLSSTTPSATGCRPTGHLRAPVRRPEGHRHGRPRLHHPGREPEGRAPQGRTCTRRARWPWPTSTTRRRRRAATPAAASSSSSTRTASCRPTTRRSATITKAGMKVLKKIAEAGVEPADPRPATPPERDRRDQQGDRDEILTAGVPVISVARDADSRPAGRLCWP